MKDLQTAMEDAIAKIWEVIQDDELNVNDIPAIAEYLIAQTSETIRKKGDVRMKVRPGEVMFINPYDAACTCGAGGGPSEHHDKNCPKYIPF